jgi:hypothetical protein
MKRAAETAETNSPGRRLMFERRRLDGLAKRHPIGASF